MVRDNNGRLSYWYLPPLRNNYLNPVRADEEVLDLRLHTVGDPDEVLYARVGRSGLRLRAGRRARAQAKLLPEHCIDVDDEGRPGVFAVCFGSWSGGRWWRKVSSSL